jgi:hypothetical protein
MKEGMKGRKRRASCRSAMKKRNEGKAKARILPVSHEKEA